MPDPLKPFMPEPPQPCAIVSLPPQKQQLIDYINSPEFANTTRVEFHKSGSYPADDGRK